MPQVVHPEPADGPDPGAGVNERPEDRPVPKSEHTICLDGGEEMARPPARLGDGHLGRATVPEGVAHPLEPTKMDYFEKCCRW